METELNLIYSLDFFILWMEHWINLVKGWDEFWLFCYYGFTQNITSFQIPLTLPLFRLRTRGLFMMLLNSPFKFSLHSCVTKRVLLQAPGPSQAVFWIALTCSFTLVSFVEGAGVSWVRRSSFLFWFGLSLRSVISPWVSTCKPFSVILPCP